MTTATDKSVIPTRDQIDDKYKWNLADLYADDNAWEADYRAALELVDRAAAFMGSLDRDAATLWECLTVRTELSRKVSRLYTYAYLCRDLDNRVSTYQAMNEKAAMLGSKAGAAYAFVEPELLGIDEKRLLQMASQFERKDVYDFFITELLRSKAHIRSAEVEELLAQSAMIARAPDSIFTMLNDADFVYPTVRDEQGREVQLTKMRFAKFLESSDRRVRCDAYNGFYTVYQAHLNALGASLGASINKDVFYSRARRFDSCLQAALDGDNIPEAVYRKLIETTEANLAPLHKYADVRKRALELDELHAWDLYCPLFPDQDYEVEYDKAVETILTALRPMGETYCDQLKRSFDSRWVDVFETAGKGSGAYSTGVSDVHPYVLMNYNDTVDNMFTLAHEMGHAMHSYLSSKAQPYPKAQYSIFVAEVASTLNEGLLQHHLLKQATDTRQKLYLLNRQLDNTWGTFFNQVLRAHFELQTHTDVEQGNALAPERLNERDGDLVRRYNGPGVAFGE